MLGLEVLLSAVLCFCISKEKHSQSSSCWRINAFGGQGVCILVLKRCEMTVIREGWVLSVSASITWVWLLTNMWFRPRQGLWEANGFFFFMRWKKENHFFILCNVCFSFSKGSECCSVSQSTSVSVCGFSSVLLLSGNNSRYLQPNARFQLRSHTLVWAIGMSAWLLFCVELWEVKKKSNKIHVLNILIICTNVSCHITGNKRKQRNEKVHYYLDWSACCFCFVKYIIKKNPHLQYKHWFIPISLKQIYRPLTYHDGSVHDVSISNFQILKWNVIGLYRVNSPLHSWIPILCHCPDKRLQVAFSLRTSQLSTKKETTRKEN